MAMPVVNVFGSPVTDETVKHANPDLGGRPITARERAQVALEYINEDDRLMDVLRFTFNIRRDGYGDGTATRGMIYNATGGDLTLVLNHTWEGYVWRYPYPPLIRNGQWAGFLHVTDSLAAHSKEAVVYRGTNGDGLSHDWMLTWNTFPGPTTTINNLNHAYTEIRAGFDWPNWYTIDAAMDKRSSNAHSSTSLGCSSGVWIESGSTPVFAGLTSLDGLGVEFTDVANQVRTISQSLPDVV